ncbi:hypothetical protein GGS26DRAFT_586274 [Hypomontagnella submonticulosa]|nr:hypothetical protein GGS26DRAFT_586274 [Hypomontagnella submonticulosa]
MTESLLCPHLENRTLVYDPRIAQVSIKKTKKVKNDRYNYWELSLIEPTKGGLDCWDLFMDKDGEKTWAQRPEDIPNDGYFIARLNLRTLGILGRFYRKYGKLQTVYILKPEGN